MLRRAVRHAVKYLHAKDDDDDDDDVDSVDDDSENVSTLAAAKVVRASVLMSRPRCSTGKAVNNRDRAVTEIICD